MVILLMMAGVLIAGMLSGCGESSAPATVRAAAPGSQDNLDQGLVDAIARASYGTSPPGHPSLGWAELAPRIAAARSQLDKRPALDRPARSKDPLAERISSVQARTLSQARQRAMVMRAEAARLLARGTSDQSAQELVAMLTLADVVAGWGTPASAETSAWIIASVLDALAQPDNAALSRALSTGARARLRHGLSELDANDPAGRLRAITETIAAREAAMRSRSEGPDGPVVVRGIASRYAPGADRATAEELDRLMREAVAFSRAMADGWDKPSRPAITARLRQRQAEDPTGVLVVLLGEAPDACDADAQLRERIGRMVERLR
ncbi:MAG: hypothetical protein ACIAS6_11365 [Phycisphaerales bacterium JB060]